ncbi:MAG: hypothetical protein ACAH65_09325 [Chloroflexota bacterium]
MFPMISTGLDRSRLRRATSMTLLAAFLLVGCSAILEDEPVATPVPFPEISGFLGQHGLVVSNYTSGDAGCTDQALIPTAIAFDVAGLDAVQPLRLRIYIFRDRATWERRRAAVDDCVATWATDPATFEFVDASPYVVAGQGPWPPKFKAALREAITQAAGNGG